MKFFLFCLVSVIANVSGQTLLDVLSSNLELTTLHHYVNGSSSLTSLLSSLSGFTLLAPSNAAFSNLLASRNETTISDTEMVELVQYHILNGHFPANSWSSEPQFVATYLTNPAYTNVTGGQVVELVSDSQGNPLILSWNKTVSTITTQDISCTGGLIQIISDFLTVPLQMGSLLLNANFNYFAAGLYEIGITNTSSFDPVASYVNATDVTFFVPNSAAALNAFTDITSNASNLSVTLNILKYHMVLQDLVYSTEFQNGMQLTAATGKNITISKQDGDIFVNQAKITNPDYLVCNGVVHIIDGLLDDLFDTTQTPTPTPTPTPTSTPNHSAISKATTSSSLSTEAKVAIGVTIGVILPIIIAAVLIWYFRIRKPTLLAAENNTPERRRSYVHNNADSRGNKVNRVLGQDLQLDPPLLSSEKFLKASANELDATPMKSPSVSDGTMAEFPEKNYV